MAQVRRRRASHVKASTAGRAIRDFIIMGAVMAAVVFVAISLIRGWTKTTTGQDFFSTTDVFLKGISVNGIDLAGMTFDEGKEAVHKQIDDRLNSTISLHYGSDTYTVTPASLSARMTEVDNYLAQAWSFGHVGNVERRREQVAYLENGNDVSFDCGLEYDEALLDQFVAMVKVNVDKQYVNATIEADKSENFTVTPHMNGLLLDADALRAQIVGAIEQGTSANIELKPGVWHPEFTAEDLIQAGQLLAQRKTNSASSDANRTKNIIRALKPFNKGIRVDPGETKSFNDIVGKRTIAEGFFTAPEIVDGALAEGVGGGTCQASSTLFPALVEAGFTIEQRTQHSLRVAYCKPSQDSTVTNSGKDLVFTNNTKFPMYIFGYANYSDAVVRIYGRKPEFKLKYVTKYIEENIKPKGYTAVPDKKGKKAKVKGDMVLKKEGKDGCITEGWIQYYNRDTGEFIKEERMFHDEYAPVKPEYYVYWAGD